MFGFNKSKSAQCPLWRSPCKEHGCLWYVRLTGRTADGETHDEYGCVMAVNARLTLEAAQASHQAGSSADKVANEVRAFHETMNVQNQDLLNSISHNGAEMKVISGGSKDYA